MVFGPVVAAAAWYLAGRHAVPAGVLEQAGGPDAAGSRRPDMHRGFAIRCAPGNRCSAWSWRAPVSEACPSIPSGTFVSGSGLSRLLSAVRPSRLNLGCALLLDAGFQSLAQSTEWLPPVSPLHTLPVEHALEHVSGMRNAMWLELL